jgi:uncharacterized protein with HEPN domain
MANEHLYLKNIIEAIDKISLYTEGFDEQSFQADSKTQDAVIRQLEIIGEAARLLPDSVKQANPQVPWRDISGMRNHLIHRYFKVDIDEVWRTAQSDLSPLKLTVEGILAGWNL